MPVVYRTKNMGTTQQANKNMEYFLALYTGSPFLISHPDK
jgi:hypothetical protein